MLGRVGQKAASDKPVLVYVFEKSGEGEKDEANEKHFKVTNITMISDTCPAAGTARKTKKSKSDGESGAPPSN